MEQSIAGLISDRATDEVLEALTRYKRGMGIPDSPNTTLNDLLPPDIVRSRSSHVSLMTFLYDETEVNQTIAQLLAGFDGRASSCRPFAPRYRITNCKLPRLMETNLTFTVYINLSITNDHKFPASIHRNSHQCFYFCAQNS